jgi:hypothetical protein
MMWEDSCMVENVLFYVALLFILSSNVKLCNISSKY